MRALIRTFAFCWTLPGRWRGPICIRPLKSVWLSRKRREASGPLAPRKYSIRRVTSARGALASRRVPNPADYGALVNGANGGTPLSAHMARVAVAQAKRAPHKRRVVFVITDGQCDYGPATLKRMANYLEQSCGVVLAHVSIGTPVSGCFRAEVCVPHGVPLAKVGLDHFVKVIQAI